VIVPEELLHWWAAIIALTEGFEKTDGLELVAWRIVLSETDEDRNDPRGNMVKG
jgi:hypothetical protein